MIRFIASLLSSIATGVLAPAFAHYTPFEDVQCTTFFAFASGGANPVNRRREASGVIRHVWDPGFNFRMIGNPHTAALTTKLDGIDAGVRGSIRSGCQNTVEGVSYWRRENLILLER